MIKFLISILIFLSFNYSQNNEIKISDISVTGNDLMLEQDIINFSGLSKESFINAIEIQNAINRLWLLNKFSNMENPIIPSAEANIPFTIGSALPSGPSPRMPKTSPCRNTRSKKFNIKLNSIIAL